MKKCPWCSKEYPDGATECSVDRQELVPFTRQPAETAHVRPDRTWLPQIAVPTVLWLVTSILLAGLFTPGASMLFGLATAWWAAVDCSKLQYRGSRVLGIAFKPVVVFAVCAFFLWGLGFVWYLVMRHRVKNAPLDLASGSVEPAV